MPNRNEAAGSGKNATWGPSFVVKINPDGTTEVLDGSVTNQQGIWHEPCHLSEVFQNYPKASSVQQVDDNNHLNSNQNSKNMAQFQSSLRGMSGHHLNQMAYASDVSGNASKSNLDRSESDLEEVSMSNIGGKTTSINFKRSKFNKLIR